MPALLLLASALGLNYHRHRRGLSTICSTCRKRIGPRLMTGIWLGVTAWFLPHYARPFFHRVAVLVDDALAPFDIEETP